MSGWPYTYCFLHGSPKAKWWAAGGLGGVGAKPLLFFFFDSAWSSKVSRRAPRRSIRELRSPSSTA